MFTTTTRVPFLLAALIGASSAITQNSRLLRTSENGLEMIRLLQQRQMQDAFEDMPDICAGFELIIDEIPEGRDSCDCDGSAVHCLFHADSPDCPEGQECAIAPDAVLYEVAFEEKELTVLSCAAIAAGDFAETCAKVSLAPDLQLDQCLLATYGQQPCDCDICPDRASLLLDCSMYDKRAITDCHAAGLGQLTPMVHGFNTSATPEQGLVNPTDGFDEDGLQSASGAPETAMALSFVAAIALMAALR